MSGKVEIVLQGKKCGDINYEIIQNNRIGLLIQELMEEQNTMLVGWSKIVDLVYEKNLEMLFHKIKIKLNIKLYDEIEQLILEINSDEINIEVYNERENQTRKEFDMVLNQILDIEKSNLVCSALSHFTRNKVPVELKVNSSNRLKVSQDAQNSHILKYAFN